MGCNCGKKKETPKGEQQTFRLEFDSGESFVFGSRLEAEAARVRSKRRGVIRSIK